MPVHLDDYRPASFPYRGRQALLPSGRVAYFDEGEGDALVFVHGLGGDFCHFEHVAPAFDREHRVVGIDLPGCGASPPLARRYTVERYADVLLELLSFLGIRRATLVGHSAGGQVVAEAASREPGLASGLVLINSAGMRAYGPITRAAARWMLQPALLRFVLPRTATRILDRVFAAQNEYTRKFVDDSLRRPRHPVLRNMARLFHELVPDLLRPTVLERAPSLAMPVLVLQGGLDALVPMAAVEAVVRRFPGAQLVRHDECGHMPIIEQPEWTTSRIREFLSRTSCAIERRKAA